MLFVPSIVLLLAVLSQCGVIVPIDSNSLSAFSSNKGEKSYYEFRFLTSNSIDSSAFLEIAFPLDFDFISFPKIPECYYSQKPVIKFSEITCTISRQGIVKAKTDVIVKGVEMSFIVGQVINPSRADSTSQFRVRTFSNEVLIDANDQFGFISFAESPREMISASVYKLSNDHIKEGSSWEFKFTPSTSYISNNSLRFTFPKGFSTNQVLCNVDGLSGSQPVANVLFNQRVVTCSNMQKQFLGGEESIKIINMINPDYSGLFVGFTVEILLGQSTVVLEKQYFSGNIFISPGQASVTYTSSDKLRLSNSTYTFFINLVNPVYYGGKMFVNFTQDWTLFNPNCTIISGFYLHKNQPVLCSLITNSKTYVIENFEKIDNSMRIVISLLVQTPDVENQFPVAISSYNTEKGSIVDLKTIIININSTYGQVKRFVAHSQKLPYPATAGKCGSLEMDFFLKTFLPKSDIDSFGKMRIDIFPQIPIPDASLYGQVQCQFYGDIPSANDCSDTAHSIFISDSTRLKIYYFTPKDYSFQTSEQPVVITTAGKDEQYCAGFVIDPLVQRYLIHIQIWSRQSTGSSVPSANSTPDTPTVDPDEVYFTDWMPKYRLINGPDDPDLISTALPNKPTYQSAPTLTYVVNGIEADSFTFLEFTYTHKDTVVKDYTLRSAATRNYVLRVNFYSGWDTTLGFNPTSATDSFIKNFPCLLKGTLIDSIDPTKEHTACDLYIGSPYPYLQVNNIPTLSFDVNNYIYIGIPKIKIGAATGAPAIVWVEVLEETPGFWDPIVFVYKSANMTLFNSAPPCTVSSSSYAFSTDMTLNANPTYTFSYSTPYSSTTKATIYWDSNLPIAFEEVSCTGISGTLTCIKFGAPVYWIYVTGNGLQTNNVNLVMPVNTSINLSYEVILTFTMQVWELSSQLITFKQTISPVYPPATMTSGSYVSSIAQPLYWYQGYTSSHTITFTLVQPVPDDWRLKFVFTGGQSIMDNKFFQLTSTNLVSLDSRGMLFTFNNGDTFIIYNLQALAASVTVSITLTVTQPTSSPSAAAVTITTLYKLSPYPRINYMLKSHQDQPFTLTQKSMTDFKMINPISFKTDPIVGQIGSFNFKFQPGQFSLNDGDQIILYWEKLNGATPGFAFHYNTVSSSIVTPICSINQKYHPCSADDSNSAFITVTITLLSDLFNSVSYDFEISTDIAGPDQGLIFPAVSNYYQFKLEAQSQTQKYSTYFFIRPIEFSIVTTVFAHTTASKPNLIEITFVPSAAVNSFSNGGRIQLIFPTNQNGSTKFQNNLGLGTHNPGCYFTGAFAKESTASSMMCLINYATLSDANHQVVIDIINFDALTVGTTYTVLIGGIINPSSANTEVRFTLLSSQITTATNLITYVNSWVINIDLLNYNSGTTTWTSTSSTTFTTFLQDQNVDVVHSIKYTSAMVASDYFISDVSTSSLGEIEISGTEQNIGNIKTCNTALYTFCVYMKEIQWIVWKLKTPIAANTAQSAYIPILQSPFSVQKTSATYYSHYISTGKYIVKITETISASTWSSLAKAPTSVSMTMSHPSEYYNQNRAKSEINISFTTSRDLYSTGSIEIAFDPTYTPYHHCRSQISLGSLLYSLAGNNIGEIGCKVQSTSWYITGFSQLSSGSLVVIQGMVNLPTTPGTFSVYTYGTTDDVSINTNGLLIEKITGVAGTAITSVNDFQFNSPMLLQNYIPLRVGHQGEYRINLKFSSALNDVQNFNFILSRQKLIGSSPSNSDGFQSLNSISTSIRAYAIKASDNSIVPLALSSYSETSTTPSDLSIVFKTSTSIAANTDYVFVLNTQQMDSTKQDGVIYPASPGLYRVLLYHESPQFMYTDYVEVYGTDFTSLTLTSTNNQAGKENLLCFSFQPSVAITASDLFFISFETQTLDSIILFPDNLGYTVKTYQKIPGDIIGATGSASCYMVRGFSTYYLPAKIYCTGFSVSTATTAYLWITVTNPATVAQDMTIPIIVYTLSVSSSGEYSKKNWSILEQSFKLLSTVASVPSTVTPSRSDLNFGTSSGLIITFPTPVAMAVGDMLIVNANFTGIPSIASSTAGTCTSGTMTLLGSNKKLLCLFTSAVSVSTNIDFSTTGADQFYNPWTQLTASELQLKGQTSFLSDLTLPTKSISCNSMTQLSAPTLAAGTVTISNPKFVDSNVIKELTNVLFSFTSTNLDQVTSIKYTHGISGISLDTSKTECLMASTSEIEISSCYHDGSIYYLTIIPSSVSTVKIVSFITQNKPLSTPSSSSAASYSPVVQFYSSSSLLIFTSNVATSSVSLFADPDSTVVGASVIGFLADTFTTIQERYFDFIPFYISNSPTDTGPISFIYSAKEAQSSGTVISFQFPSLLKSITLVQALYSTNVEIYRYILQCQVNGIDQSSCSFLNGLFTVNLSQSLVLNTKYTFYFNIIDQLNQPALQGFYYGNTSTTDQTVGTIKITTNTKVFLTDFFYFATNKAKFGNIFDSVSCSVSSSHSVASSNNLLTISLSLTASSLNLIIFEFQSATSAGVSMFTSNTMFSMGSGSNFPCSGGTSTTTVPRCWIQAGIIDSSSSFSKPIRIYMSGFTYTTSTPFNIYLMIQNPLSGADLNLNIYALDGTSEQEQTMSGFLQFFQVLRATGSIQSLTSQIITISGPSYASYNYLFPRQGSAFMMILLPLSTCTYQGAFTTQQEKLFYVDPSSSAIFQVLFYTSATTPYSLSTISCTVPTTIVYYEVGGTSSTLYHNSGTITSTEVTSLASSSLFSIYTSRTAFYDIASFTDVQGILSLSVSQNIVSSQVLSLAVNISSGINLSKCAARVGFFSASGSDISTGLVSCVKNSGTQFTLSNFYQLKTSSNLEIQLLYTTDASVGSAPSVTVTLSTSSGTLDSSNLSLSSAIVVSTDILSSSSYNLSILASSTSYSLDVSINPYTSLFFDSSAQTLTVTIIFYDEFYSTSAFQSPTCTSVSINTSTSRLFSLQTCNASGNVITILFTAGDYSDYWYQSDTFLFTMFLTVTDLQITSPYSYRSQFYFSEVSAYSDGATTLTSHQPIVLIKSSSSSAFLSVFTATSLSWTVSALTELSLTFTLNSQYTLDTSKGDYIAIELTNGTAYPLDLISGITSSVLKAEIDCLCYLTSATTTRISTTCYRHYSISSSNQSIISIHGITYSSQINCKIPQVVNPSAISSPNIYLSHFNGPLLQVSQLFSKGSITSMSPSSFYSAPGGGSPTLTSSSSTNTFTVGSSNSITMTASFSSVSKAYLIFTKQSSTNALTSTTSCSTTDLSKCRVYTTINNILISTITSGASSFTVNLDSSLNKLSYSDITSKYPHQFYIIYSSQTLNPSSTYSWSTIAFPSSSSNAPTTNFALNQVAKNFFSPFVIAYTPPATFSFSSTSAIVITPATYQVSGCSATYSTYVFKCIVSSNVITVQINQSLPASSTITIVVGGQMQDYTTSSFSSYYCSSYTSSTNYYKAGDISFTISGASSSQGDNISSTVPLKLTQFNPIIPITSLSTKAPFRVQFQHSSASWTTFSSVKLILKGTGQLADSTSTITSKSGECYYKQFDSYGSYQLYPAEYCTISYDSGNSYNVITAGLPLQGSSVSNIFLTGTVYELVVSSNSFSSTPGLVWSISSGEIIKVIFLVSASSSFYGEAALSYKNIPLSSFSLSKFYYTSSSQASDTSFYLELTTPSIPAFPSGYLEIIIPKVGSSAFTTKTPTGQSIPCWLSGVSTPSGQTLSPRCIVNIRSTNLIIKILSAAAISSGATVKIAIDDVTLPTSGTTLYFALYFNSVGYDSSQNPYYIDQKRFSNMFALTGTVTPTTTTPSVTLSGTQFGQTSLSITFNSNFATPLTQNTGSTKPSKVKIRVSGGWFAMSSYSLSISNFYEYPGYVLSQIWSNPNTMTIYAETLQVNGYLGNTKPQVTNLINPNLDDKTAYESSLPILQFKYYGNYIQSKTVTPVLSYPTLSSFSSYSSSVGMTVSPLYDNLYAPNHIIWLSIKIPISSQSTIFSAVKGSFYTTITLTSTSGIDTFYECAFLLSGNLLINTPCDVISQTAIVIANIAQETTTVSPWYVFVRAKITSSSVSLQFSLDQFLYSSSTWSSNTMWQFTDTCTLSYYQSSYSTPTSAVPSLNKYFQNFYNRQLSILSPSLATIREANFQLTSVAALSAGNTVSFEFKSYTNTILDPGSKLLYCTLLKQISSNVYSLAKQTVCSYSTGIYTFTIPTGGIIASQTFLLNVSFDKTDPGYFQTVYSTPQKQYLYVTVNSQINVAVIEIKDVFNSMTFTQYSNTADSWDYLQINLSPKTNFAAGTTTEERMIIIELKQGQYPADGGIPELYTMDNIVFLNGQLHDFKGTSALSAAQNIAQIGLSSLNQSFKFAIVGFSSLTAGTAYTIKIPMIKNGSINYQGIIIVKTVEYSSTSPNYAVVYNEQVFIKNQLFSANNAYSCSSTTLSNSPSIRSSTNGATVTAQVCQNTNAYYGNNTPTATAGELYIMKPFSNKLGYDIQNWGGKTVSAFTSVEQFSVTKLVVGYMSAATANNCYSVSCTTFTSSDEAVAWGFSLYMRTYLQSTYTFCTSTTTKTFSTYSTALSGTLTATLLNTTPANKNTNIIVKLIFSVRKLPVGTYFKISTNANCQFNNHFIHKVSLASGASLTPNTDSIISYTSSSSDSILTVKGYTQIAQGTSLQMIIGVKVTAASGSMTFTYTAVGVLGSNLESFTIGSIPIDTSYYINSLTSDFRYQKQLSPGTWNPIQLRFKLNANTVNYSISTNRLEVTIPSDFTRASTTYSFVQYQITNNYYMVDSISTSFATTPIQCSPPSTLYDISNANEYQMLLTTRLATNNNFFYPSTYGYQTISMVEFETASPGTEFLYDYWVVQPDNDYNLVSVTPLTSQAGDWTVLQFSWHLTVAAVSGDEIWIEFQTNNGAYTDATHVNQDKVFSNDLGTGQIKAVLDCAEESNTTLISNSKLLCDIIREGDDSQVDYPTIVRIQITKSITSGTTLGFLVAGIRNSLYGNRRSVLTVSLRKTCVQTGFTGSNKLAYQISKSEYTTTQNLAFFDSSSPTSTVNYSLTQPQLAPSTSFSATGIVWDLSKSHTWTVVSSSVFQNGDWIAVYYTLNNNSVMSKKCTPVGQCYVFPSLGLVLGQVQSASGTQYSHTLTLGGLNNGLFRYGGQFYIEHWSGNVGTPLLTAYVYNGLTYTYYTSPITFVIKPTLTPQESGIIDKYWLRDFVNVAKITINGSWNFNNIKSFWLLKPTQINAFDMVHPYCNATLTIPSAQRKPFSYRFNCKVQSTYRISLELTSDFPSFSSAIQGTYDILMYVRMYISEFQASGTTNAFQFYSSDYSVAQDDQNHGVTHVQGYISISTYIQPDMRYVQISSTSFQRRKATPGDQIFWQLMVEPLTPLSSHQVDKMVFRIPDQFKYPAISLLDKCTMVGDVTTIVNLCTLARIDGHTYITLYPDAFYDNTPKVVKLYDTTNAFTVPEWPGGFYNITIQIYSGSLLLETQTVNVTRILGYSYKSNTVKVTNILDPNKLGLFYFESQLGSRDVLPGFNTDSAQMFSSLEYSFDNADGYFLQDLGTGLLTGGETPCLASSQLTTYVTGKISCYLTVGTGVEDLPTINVFGYDLIPQGTAFKVFFPQLSSLGLGIQGNTFTKIRIYYKNINFSDIYYEITSYSTGITTAAASLTASSVTTTTSANNQVGQTRDYTFSFSLSGTLTTSDYIFFTFPKDYFDKNGDFSVVTCTGFNIQVYGVSNQIYLNPLASQSGTISITIANLINAAYSQNKQITIVGEQLNSMKIVKKINFLFNQSLNQPILPCSSFQEALTYASTTVSGQNDITFTVSFMTGHFIPSDGSLTISMPATYSYNFLYLNSSCILEGFPESAKCQVGGSTRIDIFLGGTKIASGQQYTVKILHLNSQTLASSPQMMITSYYNQNIYLQQKICEMGFSYPLFLDSGILYNCYLQVDATILTSSSSSFYSFSLECENRVRDNTLLSIDIPKEYYLANAASNVQYLTCSSDENVILGSQECYLDRNGRSYFLNIQLNSIEANSLFSIQVLLTNPSQTPSAGYSFSGGLSSYQIPYASITQSGSNLILNDSIQIATSSPDLVIQNIPKSSGAAATFIFAVPPQTIQSNYKVAQISIKFSEEFSSQLGHEISCAIYQSKYQNSTLYDSYESLLQLSLLKNYTALPCLVESMGLLVIDTTVNLQKQQLNMINLADLWQHILISNVINPQVYNSSNIFSIQYSDSSNNLLFSFSNTLVYRISSPPLYLKISKISSSIQDIRSLATFSIKIQSATFLPANPSTMVSFTLPYELYSTVKVMYFSPNLSSCKVFNQDIDFNVNCTCYIYFNQNNIQVVTDVISFVNLNSTDTFDLEINSLYTPDTQYTCDSSNRFQYQIKLIDFQSGDITSISSPSVDDTTNCLQFSQISQEAIASGPLTVLSGLSYEYTISLSSYASGLTVTPISPSENIYFTPSSLVFSNFTTMSLTFKANFRSDTVANDYVIKFEMDQRYFSSNEFSDMKFPSQMFLQIIPIVVTVIKPDISSLPTVTIQDLTTISVGLPIKVKVALSAAPATPMSIIIQVVSQFSSILQITPSILELDAGSTLNSFEITLTTSQVPETYFTLSFSLTSLFPLTHQLTSQVKYLSFKADRTYSSQYSLLSISLLDTFQITQTYDQKVKVLYSNQTSNTVIDQLRMQQLKPQILYLKLSSTTANSATFQIFTSQACTMNSGIILYGDSSPTISQIASKSSSKIIQYQQNQVPFVPNAATGTIDYTLQFPLDGLLAQTNYELLVYLEDSFGKSELSSISFKTTRAPFGYKISLPLTSVIDPELVIQALSLTMKISSTRLNCTTDSSKIKEKIDRLNKSTMMISSINYDIIVAPNMIDSNESTLNILSELNNDSSIRQFLKRIIPSFDLDSIIPISALLDAVPTISKKPEPAIINYNDVTIKVQLWQPGKVFAILREIYDLDSTHAPVSTQIANGHDEANTKISEYQSVETETDLEGNCSLFFDDLNDGTDYKIFIVLGSKRSYYPPNLSDDKDIIVVSFTTPFNINLGAFEDKLSSIKKANPDLADAISRFSE